MVLFCVCVSLHNCYPYTVCTFPVDQTIIQTEMTKITQLFTSKRSGLLTESMRSECKLSWSVRRTASMFLSTRSQWESIELLSSIWMLRSYRMCRPFGVSQWQLCRSMRRHVWRKCQLWSKQHPTYVCSYDMINFWSVLSSFCHRACALNCIQCSGKKPCASV